MARNKKKKEADIWIVYKATSPNGKVYIGMTHKTLEKRKAEHEKESLKEKYKNNAFKRALRKHDYDFEWETLEANIESHFEAELEEIMTIEDYN